MDVRQHIDEKWAKKEMELNQRHEDVLAERAKLLSAHKIIIQHREKMVQLNSCSFERARRRKNKLKQEIESFERQIQSRNNSHDVDSKLDILKVQYWQMVTKELSSL